MDRLGVLKPVARQVTIFLGFAIVVPLFSDAQNRISLNRGKDNLIELDLANSDPIAGLQFTVNAAGAELGSFEASERSNAAGLMVYQYRPDRSTLNVIILAPYRSSLSAGASSIGSVSFLLLKGEATDSVHIRLSRVVACDADAEYLKVSITDLSWNISDMADARYSRFTMEQNFPNPFNPSTNIVYSLSTTSHVRLTVHDVAGRQVRVLVDESRSEGKYSVTWCADNQFGETVAAGVYLLRMRVGSQATVKRILFLK